MGVNLLSSTSVVQTPYIVVKIGRYEFGCYNKDAIGSRKYPNYIDSLNVQKINGEVNKYELKINYSITENDDPNYFEKVFSSISTSRKITFTYGDLSSNNYIYKEEEAIITGINSDFSVAHSLISYTISAVSSGSLGYTGGYPFPAPSEQVYPSAEIKKLLQDSTYGLQDLFTGMRNMTLVDQYNLIPHSDEKVYLETKTNISPLDYLQYLVSMMSPSKNTQNIVVNNFYILTFEDDVSGIFGGPYFKIVNVDREIEHPEAYDLYIGYPSINYVTSFNIENRENYSIFYDYQEELHPEKYVKRISTTGEYEDVYAPVLSSNNNLYETKQSDRDWWTKVSQYPISASVTIKGLLRPATLMSYVRLYVSFYGRLHVHSGLYIVTKQADSISERGYSTTLNLTRIANDESMTII